MIQKDHEDVRYKGKIRNYYSVKKPKNNNLKIKKLKIK